MIELIKQGKILWSILQDGKITKEEAPAFLEALAAFIAALVSVVLPFIKGGAATAARRLASGVALAATMVKR